MIMPALVDVAKLFNISSDALWAKLETVSLASFAQSQNVSVSQVKDTMPNSFKQQLADALKAGKITQAQHDQILKDIPADFIDGFINSVPNPNGSRKKVKEAVVGGEIRRGGKGRMKNS